MTIEEYHEKLLTLKEARDKLNNKIKRLKGNWKQQCREEKELKEQTIIY